jgi:hypothetical protein
LATILAKNAPPGLDWHYEKMPEEKHSTIFHPAALKAFRSVLKPLADRARLSPAHSTCVEPNADGVRELPWGAG